MVLLVRSESHTYPVKISWSQQKAWIPVDVSHPRESACSYKLKRSDTGLLSFTGVHGKCGRPGEWLTLWWDCFVPWATIHLAVSPYNFVHSNCSSWVSTTDLLTSWGGDRHSGHEGENALVGCLDQIIGASHPQSWTHSQHTEKNPVLSEDDEAAWVLI